VLSPLHSSCLLASGSCILPLRFSLTFIRFPYRFPNKPIRYLVHQQLNLSCFSCSSY
jgi:hypothetical protein